MARLSISDGTTKREVELVDAVTVAGRSSDNKIHIEDKQASRRHFQIEKTEFGFKLVDLESRNGSRVNDRVVNQALLRPGDRIQIGKHTLTFEDAHFKEPSADVAARFAPPPAEVVKALPPPPSSATPSAAEPEPESRTRRRTSSGHTTAMIVQRTARMESVKEQQMIRWVGVGAGLFIAVLVILIVLPGSPAGPSTGGGKVPTPPKPGEIDPKKAAALAEAEQRDFDALFEFCDKNRANPGSFDRILELCTQFRQKYPSSLSLPKVEDFVKTVTSARQGVRNKEVDEGTAAAQEQARKNDFAGSIKAVNAMIARHKDVELNAKLVKLHDDLVDQAKEHFKGRQAEAKDLVAAGSKDQAARIYESLVSSLGDSAVPELDVWCQIAKTALSGLK